MPPDSRPFFTADDIAQAIDPTFLDPDRCRLWILERLHPNGAACPRCAAPVMSEIGIRAFWAADRLKCSHCRRSFMATDGTFLEHISLSLPQLILVGILSKMGLKGAEVARAAGTSEVCAYAWSKRLSPYSHRSKEDLLSEGLLPDCATVFEWLRSQGYKISQAAAYLHCKQGKLGSNVGPFFLERVRQYAEGALKCPAPVPEGCTDRILPDMAAVLAYLRAKGYAAVQQRCTPTTRRENFRRLWAVFCCQTSKTMQRPT